MEPRANFHTAKDPKNHYSGSGREAAKIGKAERKRLSN